MAWGLTDNHYNDVIMSALASQITGVSIVYLTVSSGADQIRQQSFASLAFLRGIHWWQENSPHKRACNAENVSIWRRHHEVAIGSVNGLMPAGNQPITWTNIDPNLYCLMTSLRHNAFNRYVQIVVCYSWYWLLYDGIYIYLWMTVWQKLFDELLLNLEMTMISQYSGSRLVPSGSKQLPEPTSTESRYMASPSHIVV